jgi:hypothetical protein
MEGAMMYMVLLLLLQVSCLVENVVDVQFLIEVDGMEKKI